MKLEEVKEELNNIEKNLKNETTIEVDKATYKTETKEAIAAYELAQKNPSVDNIENMFELSTRLHNEQDRSKILRAEFTLLEVSKSNLSEDELKRIETKIKKLKLTKEKNKNLKQTSKKLIKRKEELEIMLSQMGTEKDSEIKSLNTQKQLLIDDKQKEKARLDEIGSVVSTLVVSLKEKGFVDKSDYDYVNDLNEIDLSENNGQKEKIKFLERIKQIFTSKKEDEEEEKINLEPVTNETLTEPVLIKKIIEPKKSLYEKTKESNFRKSLSNALDYLKEKHLSSIVATYFKSEYEDDEMEEEDIEKNDNELEKAAQELNETGKRI